MKRLFVTGTNTGIGKTRVTASLAGFLQQKGKQVAALKPLESGCHSVGDRLVAEDADILRAAANMTTDNCLYRLQAPLAPAVAARQEDVHLDWERICQWIEAVTADVVLVEGAGGWFVPLTNEHFISDLPASIAAPVLIVAAPTLGTINHTLLTAFAVAQQAKLAGFLSNEQTAVPKITLQQNVDEIMVGAARLGLDLPYWGHLSVGGTLAELELTPAATKWLLD